MADPKEQGDDEDDRVEPTQAERDANSKLVDDVAAGRKKIPTYDATKDFRPRSVGPRSDADLEPSYAKGGQVGGIRGFGLDNRSKPAFAAGGPKTNHKFDFKKGK